MRFVSGTRLLVMVVLVVAQHMASASVFSDEEAELIRAHDQAASEYGAMSSEANTAREELTDFYWSEKERFKIAPFLEETLEYYRQQGVKGKKITRVRWRLGKSLRVIGRFSDAIPHLEYAYEKYRDKKGEDHPKTIKVMLDLGLAYAKSDRVKQGVQMLEQVVRLSEQVMGDSHTRTGWAYLRLGTIYVRLGRFKEAFRLLKDARAIFELRKGPAYKGIIMAMRELAKFHMRKGHLEKAERILQSAFMKYTSGKEERLADSLGSSLMSKLGKTLMQQGRYDEARTLMERSIAINIKFKGPDNFGTLNSMLTLGIILLEQQQPQAAEKIVREALGHMEGNYGEDTYLRARANRVLSRSLLEQKKYAEASEALTATLNYVESNPGNSFLKGNTYWGMGRLRLAQGRYAEAEKYLQFAVDRYVANRGEQDPHSGRALSYLGQALEGQGKLAQAHGFYRQSMQSLSGFLAQRRTQSQAGRAGQERNLQQLYGRYLGLMIRAYLENTNLGNDPVSESFVIAEQARSRALQIAFLGMAARAAAKNERLAGLVRNEQDLRLQIGGIEEELLQAIQSFGTADEDAQVKRLRKRRIVMTRKLKSLGEDLAQQFPDYSQLMNPAPAGIADVQALLGSKEVLLSYLVEDERTLLWAVSRDNTQLHVVPLGRKALTRRVQQQRRSMDVRVAYLDFIPPYDVQGGWQLYEQLIAPAAKLISGARHLIVVPHGPLLSLPFGALVTREIAQPRRAPGALRFSQYRDVPWLSSAYGISFVPSATALVSLRKYARPAAGTSAFVGFGDPAFTVTLDAGDTGSQQRGIPAVQRAPLSSRDLSQLPRLPETAEELLHIKAALAPDEGSKIYLGAAASEANVKKERLDNYRVVAFATHGLIPRDIDGLEQPALALSPPETPGEEDDGVLQMDEVLGLSMNADWVILSACNSASADGSPHGEPLSGLARAFFYAGARALLVSLWPVESTSTQLLTTTMFSAARDNPGLTRAQMLAQARRRLIQGEGLVRDGRELLSYAHPRFWAAFIVVGEGWRK